MLKKARLLTRPTLARRDAPFPKQGRNFEAGPRFTFHASRFTVLVSDARTKQADFFSILLEDAPVLLAHLPSYVQQACPAEECRRQSGRDSRVYGSVNRCLPAGFDVVAMNDANPMCFPSIVERRLLAHQLGFPFLSAPRTDNLHR